MAVKVYCIDKIHNNNGVIKRYVLSDIYGNILELNRAEMLEMLKNKDYNVQNLQIDRIGRIVEKTVPNEANMISKLDRLTEQDDENSLFDRAYGLFDHQQMIRIVVWNERVRADVPFDRLNIKEDSVDAFLNRFENHVKNKYGFVPAKLEVINKLNGWRYIIYGRDYIDCTVLHEKPFGLERANSNYYNIILNVNEGSHGIMKVKDNENQLVGILVYSKTCLAAEQWAYKIEEKLNGRYSTPEKKERQGYKRKTFNKHEKEKSKNLMALFKR